MHKTKPKWGANYRTNFEPVDETVIQKICEAINFELNEAGLKQLKTAIGFYRHHLTIFDSANVIRKSNISATLSSLLGNKEGKTSRTLGPLPTLIQMLKEIDPITRGLLVTRSPASSHFDFEQLKQDLLMLKSAAEDLIEDIGTDQGSRPSDTALREFIKELAKIYSNCTGEKAKVRHDRVKDEYHGPFLDFVVASLNALDQKYQSRSALAKTIVRALG